METLDILSAILQYGIKLTLFILLDLSTFDLFPSMNSLLDFCTLLVLFLFSDHYFLLSAGVSSYPQPLHIEFSPKA